jgi:uncharacterized membrane protein
MSDPNQAPPPPSPPQPLISGDIFANIPQLVYLLYLLGFIIHPASLVGLVLAFVNRDGASPLERSHYDFQISTFWRGLIIAIVGIVLIFVFVGWLVLLFWAVWTIVRCVKGLSNLSRGLPMAADIGWKFG